VRVLHIGPVTPEYGGKSIGGVAIHLIDLSRYLHQKGHEIFVLASNCDDNYEKELNGIKIYGRKKNLYLNYLKDSLFELNLIKKTRERFLGKENILRTLYNYSNMKYFIKKIKPDIIHIHHIQSEFSFAYEIIKKMKIPYVATTHSYHSITFSEGKKRERNLYLVKKNMEDCENLIYVSSHLKLEARELFNKFPKNEVILFNPIDINKFKLLDKYTCKETLNLKYDKIILYVGSIIKRKGYDILLKSIERLGQKDIQVVFIGSGEKEELIQLAKELDIINQVTVIDYVSQEELIKYYNASDVVAIPSSSESFGLIYIEAMACGVPVIGTKGVPEEVIPSEDLGYRVEKNNYIELADAIKTALEKKWDKNKIRSFAEGFSWEANVGKYEEIYLKTMKGLLNTKK